MEQVWLHTNRRALLAGAAAASVVALLGFLLFAVPVSGHLLWLVRGVGGLLGLAGLLGAILLLYLRSLPRLAYQNGHLLVYLRSGEPFRVPIDDVECFFFGEAPSHLTTRAGSGHQQQVKTSTVVVRIAEAAKQWQQRPVHLLLGQWSNGYITIRGTWCEPLTVDVLRSLNNKLREAKKVRGSW